MALTRQELMRRLMAEHRIRSVSDYAEQIVADALAGHREANAVNPGYDLIAPHYGRVEVKFRQLPADGRLEERCTLSDAKESGFDDLAVIIFEPDFCVKGAVLVPYAEAWDFVRTSNYNRISYGQACGCDGAVDITAEVSSAAQR
ncbi:MAG: hypothetical protein ACLFV3_06445 [Phycisphaeraceae bacterium]